MDINKNIVKALLEKDYVSAKDSVFKSLYAKASLAMDEARFAVANGVFNAVEEDVEQIDELSKKTLGSYVKKSAKDASERTAEKTADEYAARDTPEQEKKIAQRHKGIGQAVKRLTKESAEQLDEVSPPDMEKMTGSKSAKASFTKQYGKRGKSVMYATAWKLHNKKAGIKEGTEGEELKDLTNDAMKKKTQKTKVGSKKPASKIAYDSDGY